MIFLYYVTFGAIYNELCKWQLRRAARDGHEEAGRMLEIYESDPRAGFLVDLICIATWPVLLFTYVMSYLGFFD